MDRNHGVKSSPIFITNQNIQLVKILSKSLFVFLLLINILSSCAQKNKGDLIVDDNKNLDGVTGLEVATLGSGCFWCIEAVYQTLEGVEKVESGFSGGKVDNPSYRQICTGNTCHAEVCQITFYPEKITYAELLEVFWATHDPTTLNRQGNDVGTQYRSAIFYHNEQQKEVAQKSLEAANESGEWNAPIVTEITAVSKFYKAEDNHQDYFSLNSELPYCTMVIKPKLEKFKKKFKEKLKQQ